MCCARFIFPSRCLLECSFQALEENNFPNCCAYVARGYMKTGREKNIPCDCSHDIHEQRVCDSGNKKLWKKDESCPFHCIHVKRVPAAGVWYWSSLDLCPLHTYDSWVCQYIWRRRTTIYGLSRKNELKRISVNFGNYGSREDDLVNKENCNAKKTVSEETFSLEWKNFLSSRKTVFLNGDIKRLSKTCLEPSKTPITAQESATPYLVCAWYLCKI